MGMRVEYEVRKLPDDYITKEVRHSFIDDEKAPPDRYGRKRQKMVVETVDSHGGWLFIVRGKPGHSIRLTSLEQIEAMKLRAEPRMIDNESGEEVGADGVPLIVKEQLAAAKRIGTLSGPHDTDIDVERGATGDEELGTPELGDEVGAFSNEGPAAVEKQIATLE